MRKKYGLKKIWLPILLCGIGFIAFTAMETPAIEKGIGASIEEKGRAYYDRSYAVVIGLNYEESYNPDWPLLKNACNDAKGMKKYLEAVGFQVSPLFGKDAMKKNIEKIIWETKERLAQNDRLLIYFSGHGHTENELGYIVPADGKSDVWTLLSMTNIRDWCKVDAKHVIFIMDCCFSGLALQQAKTLGIPPKSQGYLREVTRRDARQIITAGQAGETALDGGPKQGYGMFTGTLLHGLETGNADMDCNGFITGMELGAYLSSKVCIDSEDRQRPAYGPLMGHDMGEFVFFLPPKEYEETKLGEIERKEYDLPDDSSDISLEDLKGNKQRRMEAKRIWGDWLKGKKSIYDEIKNIDKDRGYKKDEKITAWKRFLNAAKEDDPFSKEDDDMRKYARGRIEYWEKLTPTPGKPTARPGKTGYTEAITGMEFVWVEPGTFKMGSNNGDSDEKPVHKVTLTQGFWMGKFEVTQGQWKKIMGSNPSYFKKGDNYPVEKVSWNDVQDFIRKLNGRSSDSGFRLPTEAEWEYACRSGGKDEKYSGGNNVDVVAWYDDNSGGKTHPVGTKAANSLGIYDMSGNVWEWCNDWYGAYPPGSVTDPAGPSAGSDRVLRGGGWYGRARACRSANRLRFTPDIRIRDLGFRLLRTP